MTTRAKTPSPNRQKNYVRDLSNGLKLTAHVSPCVFMHPGYPLQLSVTLHGQSGSPLGDAHVADPSKTSSTYTAASVRRLLDTVRVTPCPRCATPAFDPTTIQTNRGGLCEACFLSQLKAEWAVAAEAERQKLADRDRCMKYKGMVVRVTAWVHPEHGGDDYQLDWYLDAHPTPAKVGALLRSEGSSCLDDYQIITL